MRCTEFFVEIMEKEKDAFQISFTNFLPSLIKEDIIIYLVVIFLTLAQI